MKITIKCKLLENPQQHQQLLDVMETFNNASNWVAEKAFENKVFNKILLQKLVYYELKQKYNLSSQMSILIIRKVSASYANKNQREKLIKFYKYGAIDYDSRNFTIKRDNVITLMVLGSRIKIPYQSHKKLEELDLCGQCELFYDRIKKQFYINIVSNEKENSPIITENFLGVDMGIVNIATTSDGEIYSGEKVENYRKRITELKSRLQERGTKSAKRHLVKISKKENRYKKDTNHCISKKIVIKAKALGMGIKLEDLRFSIKKKTVKKFNKQLRDKNAKFGKWAFGQLREYIIYKSKIAGIPVLLVSAAYTSQICNKCGYCEDKNRLTQELFLCKKCGYSCNADYNASINISRASINKPIVAVRNNKLQTPTFR
jgi:putative transposase